MYAKEPVCSLIMSIDVSSFMEITMYILVMHTYTQVYEQTTNTHTPGIYAADGGIFVDLGLLPCLTL